MTLDTSKQVLKILGILSVIGSVFVIFTGILALFGGGAIASNMIQDAGQDLQQSAGLVIGAGAVLLCSGLVDLLKGIFCIRASGNSKYGNLAFIFSAISLAATLLSIATSLKNGNSIVSLIISIAVSIITVYAAYQVRTEYNTAQK